MGLPKRCEFGEGGAQAFVTGWELAGKAGTVIPQLKKDWMELLGIHETQIQPYADAQWKHATGKGAKPDPADFRQPAALVVTAP